MSHHWQVIVSQNGPTAVASAAISFVGHPILPLSSNVCGLSFSYQGFLTILLLLARNTPLTGIQVYSFPYVLQ